jgi:hypothetical protein
MSPGLFSKAGHLGNIASFNVLGADVVLKGPTVPPWTVWLLVAFSL